MLRRRLPLSIAVAIGLAAVAAIAYFAWPPPERAPLTTQLGGDTTRPDATRNAFGLSAANLVGPDRRRFELGDSFFTQNWVTAPSSTEARDGLGPTFNAQACASCHVLDGRGAPPADEADQTTRGLLFRLSIPAQHSDGSPIPEPNYGDQLQDRAVEGVPIEGRAVVTYKGVNGAYADGTPYSLRAPEVKFTDLAYGPMRPDTMVSARLAPQVIGMGLLEAIPESDIVSAADPDDRDDDGISGRPNYSRDPQTHARQLGRFGWKANEPTVEAQSAAAFQGDIGITSSLKPLESCPEIQSACVTAPNGGSPEIDDGRMATVTFYTRSLAVPAMRNVDAKPVKDGAEQFVAMGCDTCHTPTQKSGEFEEPALANQTFHPFTDLLLHDMGPGLADNRPDFDASGQEWRTPPLWGLGLADDLNRYRFLLHDGRARTIEEAILWHGGEGESAKERFRTAPAQERQKIIEYLESL